MMRQAVLVAGCRTFTQGPPRQSHGSPDAGTWLDLRESPEYTAVLSKSFPEHNPTPTVEFLVNGDDFKVV